MADITQNFSQLLLTYGPGAMMDLPENAVRAGDYVELFGKNMPLDDVARAAGTIGYEILTSIGLRHERRYVAEE